AALGRTRTRRPGHRRADAGGWHVPGLSFTGLLPAAALYDTSSPERRRSFHVAAPGPGTGRTHLAMPPHEGSSMKTPAGGQKPPALTKALFGWPEWGNHLEEGGAAPWTDPI